MKTVYWFLKSNIYWRYGVRFFSLSQITVCDMRQLFLTDNFSKLATHEELTWISCSEISHFLFYMIVTNCDFFIYVFIYLWRCLYICKCLFICNMSTQPFFKISASTTFWNTWVNFLFFFFYLFMRWSIFLLCLLIVLGKDSIINQWNWSH